MWLQFFISSRGHKHLPYDLICQKNPTKKKIDYPTERVEQFIPNPHRCYKCHKYGHHKDKCNRKSVCGKRGTDHSREECKKIQMCKLRWRPPGVCKNLRKMEKRKMILSVKYTRSISFLEAWKIVDAINRDKTYSQAVSSKTRTEPTSKYQNLVRNLQELGLGNWPNFIKNLRAELEEPNVKTKDERASIYHSLNRITPLKIKTQNEITESYLPTTLNTQGK